jgi:S1/P1 Nuclease
VKIRTWICGLLLSIAASTPALAWDYQGHEMVGAIADRILADDAAYANARKNVQEILGFTLQVAAPWPDCVRSVVHKDDRGVNDQAKFTYLPDYLHPEYRIPPCEPFETKLKSAKISPEQTRIEDYAKRNWYNCTYIAGAPGGCHLAFHFADVAIQRDGYDRRYVGTSDHDVVSAINACIAVLQGRPTAPAPFSIKDKKEALFLLAHFVGDLHQPLHVGAVYLDPKGGERVDPDPIGIDPETETAGGNLIEDEKPSPKGEKRNLHAEWDEIPEKWGLVPDPAMLEQANTELTTLTPGPINGWAAIWASETVKQAQEAFDGLTFSPCPPPPPSSSSCERPHKWIVHFKDRDAYERKAEKIKQTQLAKGGAHLAQILKAIWP